MTNPEGTAPGMVFRDLHIGYQEFKDLENDLKKLKKVVYDQHEVITRLIESVDKLNELEYE